VRRDVPLSLRRSPVAWCQASDIILNVLKEELPAERESRFAPFLAGTIGYAVLLLSI